MLLLSTVSGNALAPAAFAQSAESYLMQGRMWEASGILAKAPQDGPTHLLECRVAYAQDQLDAAVDQCQAAVAAMPRNSQAQMWLGRALGEKASHATLTAFSLARRSRQAFEAAVQLDPANRDAASDLGEFYVAAPSILGGGRDKATQFAASLASRFPGLAHRVLALEADKNGDLATAESEYKAEIAAKPTADAWIDLASFYRVHQRDDQMVASVRQALAADPTHGPPTYAAAGLLLEAHREPHLAEQALAAYLQSADTSDLAPTFKAHLEIGRLLAQRGDQAGAHAQYVAAAELAPQFAPARKAAGAQ